MWAKINTISSDWRLARLIVMTITSRLPDEEEESGYALYCPIHCLIWYLSFGSASIKAYRL